MNYKKRIISKIAYMRKKKYKAQNSDIPPELKGKKIILNFSNLLLVTFNFLFSTMTAFIAGLFYSVSDVCILYA